MKTLTNKELGKLSYLAQAVTRMPGGYNSLTCLAASEKTNQSTAMQSAIGYLRSAFQAEYTYETSSDPTLGRLTRIVEWLYKQKDSVANTVASSIAWNIANMYERPQSRPQATSVLVVDHARATRIAARRMADAAELRALYTTWFTMAVDRDPCASTLKDGVLALALRISRRAVKRGKK